MNAHFFWYEMPLCDYVGYMFLSAYTEMYFVSITFFLMYWEMKGCGINISSNQERVKNTVNHIYIKK